MVRLGYFLTTPIILGGGSVILDAYLSMRRVPPIPPFSINRASDPLGVACGYVLGILIVAAGVHLGSSLNRAIEEG